MDGLHLVPLVTGLSDFEAKLLAAQLGADGILWQTRGIVDSIYPFGGIDVLVPADQFDDARQVLALVVDAAPVEAGAGARGGPGSVDAPFGPDRVAVAVGRSTWWLGVVAMAAVAAVVMVRVLALA